MGRADAIEVVKRLFIAETCASPSKGAAVATILFDEAKSPTSQARGFSREELTDAVDALTNAWKLSQTHAEDVHRELGRLPGRLRKFSSKHLPIMGVTAIAGPTRKQRKDNVERLFLALEYTLPRDDAPGLVGQTLVDGLRSLGGDEKVTEYERELAAGVPYTVYEGRGNPSLRQRVLVLTLGFLIAGGLLASPPARRWIMRGLGKLDAWVMPPSTPKPSSGTVDVRPDPTSTLRNVRVKNRETLLFSSIQSTSIDGQCENGKPVVSLQLPAIPPMKELVLLRNDEIYKRYPNFRGGALDIRDEAVHATHSYVYKVAQRDAQQGDFVTSTPRSVYVPRCPSSNRIPIGQSMSVEPRQGTAPVTVHCSITATDPDGDPLKYSWSFMDYNGFTTAHGATAEHTFLYSGKYAADAYADDGRDEPQKVGGAEIVVAGQPPPLVTSVDSRRAMGFGIVVPASGPSGSSFTIRVFRQQNERGAHVVQYRFRLGYCDYPVKVRNPPMPCLTDPQASPELVHTYTEPGQYEIEVELTYDDGDMDVKPLAIVNVTPPQ